MRVHTGTVPRARLRHGVGASSRPRVDIGGSGLVGSLLAILFRRKGFAVRLFERRSDPRTMTQASGRSINLALSTRGIHALERLAVSERVLAQAVPMTGRMIHPLDGGLRYQPYGVDASQHLNSISRAGLNRLLIEEAERMGVETYFEHQLTDANFSLGQISFHHRGATKPFQSALFFGTDGSSSVARTILARDSRFRFAEVACPSGYKELTIPDDNGRHRMEKEALHIWPRGEFMLIALPNLDGSFTSTLFLDHEGPRSFSSLKGKDDVERFFTQQFPDAVPLISRLAETFFENPTGRLSSVRCFPWSLPSHRVFLLGDAAHAVLPFYGQGMNCGFEDCTVLDDLLNEELKRPRIRWRWIFREFQRRRKPATDAIAKLSDENFVEMRAKVADERFLFRGAVEVELERRFREFVSVHSRVSFTRIPYHFAIQLGQIQERILTEVCEGVSNLDGINWQRAKALIDAQLVHVIESLREPGAGW